MARFLILWPGLVLGPIVNQAVRSGSGKVNHKERQLHCACISVSHRWQRGHGPWEAPTLAVPPDSSHSPGRSSSLSAGSVLCSTSIIPPVAAWLETTSQVQSSQNCARLKVATIDTRQTRLGTSRLASQISSLNTCGGAHVSPA